MSYLNESFILKDIYSNDFWEFPFSLNSDNEYSPSFIPYTEKVKDDSKNQFIEIKSNIEKEEDINEDLIDSRNNSIINNSHKNESLIGKKRNRKRKTFTFLFKNKSFIIFNSGEIVESKTLISEVSDSITSSSRNGTKSKKGNENIKKKIRFYKPGNATKIGRKTKNIHKKRDFTHNIKKKMMGHYFKNLIINLNKILKSVGANKFFKCLSNKFIIKFNSILYDGKDKFGKKGLDMTLKEIFSHFVDICEIKKLEKNLSVIQYLENNYKQLSNIINKWTFSHIFSEYLNSKEFQNEIWNLKKIEIDEEYIKNYIIIAINEILI